jgi:hypothetical protein
MTSPASQPDSNTPGSAAALALMDIMRNSPKGEDIWLLSEITMFNVLVKRRLFPKETATVLRDTVNAILSMALSLHKDSSLVFSA